MKNSLDKLKIGDKILYEGELVQILEKKVGGYIVAVVHSDRSVSKNPFVVGEYDLRKGHNLSEEEEICEA